jgi:dipeptidyl aminopeptidase/acylaminoacyl peptidase
MKSPVFNVRAIHSSAKVLFALSFVFVAGCSALSSPAAVTETPVLPTSTVAPPTPSLTPNATNTNTPAPSPTPDPYAGITIADLQARTYGGGEIEIEGVLGIEDEFIRFLISYESDGVKIFGFMNLPNGDGPFPLIVVVHGYVTPKNYRTLAYTTPYADALARAGYFVFHPNYRNHPPSEEGPNPFRVGYAIDVLNLVAILDEGSGHPGLLEIAFPNIIGLFGHSMGGGITLRSVTVNSGIDAAVLYGAISGDERVNYERDAYWTDGQGELETPEQDLHRISSIYHLEDIQAPLSIHHGLRDTVIPAEWSTDLCDRMMAIEKDVECFDYPGQPHLFSGSGFDLFMQRVVEFFEEHLRDY